MAANRKNKLSTKRKRGENSPSFGSLAVGIKDRKAEGSLECHTDRIPAQTAGKTRQLEERKTSLVRENQTPVCDDVTSELVGLRQSLAQHWPAYTSWQNLSDLPMVNTRTGFNKSQGQEQEHGICSIGEISFQWSPLPPPCTTCMKRKRVEFSPELLKDTESVSRRESTCHSVNTARSFTKATHDTSSIKQQDTTIQVSSVHSKEKPIPKNVRPTKTPQTTPAGDTKRKTNFQENEIKATPKVPHVQGVSSEGVLTSLKSQKAMKMDGLKQAMHREATRDQPEDQAIRVPGLKGVGKRLASQTGGLKTFMSGEKPTGGSTKGRPSRIAPLFKQPASTAQRNVGAGPSMSKVQPKVGGGPELKSGRGEAGNLRSCPMCQEEFPPGMSQLDTDGHIAACLSASSEDIMW